MLCSCPQCINANQWSASAICARITRLRHPAPSTCRSDPTFLVFESNTIEPNNSIEDGASATKDLISVPLMTRKVRLHNEQYCMMCSRANRECDGIRVLADTSHNESVPYRSGNRCHIPARRIEHQH